MKQVSQLNKGNQVNHVKLINVPIYTPLEASEPEEILNEPNHVTQAHQENQTYQVNCVSQLNEENQVNQVIQESRNVNQVNQENLLNVD